MKIKNAKKQNTQEMVFYSPAYGASRGGIIAGLVLRTLLLYIGVLGLGSLIVGAAGFGEAGWRGAMTLGPANVALLALPVAFASAIASLNKITAIATPVVYAGAYMGIMAAAFGNPIDVTVKSALRVYNFALYHLSAYGYVSVGDAMVHDGYDYAAAIDAESDPYRVIGIFLLCTLLGLLLHFFIQKRALIIPTAILCAAVFAPIMTYNIARGVAGISFTLAFICGAIALKVYDYRYCGRAEAKQLNKKLKVQREKEKQKARNEKRENREIINAKANEIYLAAIESKATPAQARKARNAYFAKLRREKAEKKKADRKAVALNEKRIREKDKANKQTIKGIKKEIKKLKGVKTPEAKSQIAEKQERIDVLLAEINGTTGEDKLSLKKQKKLKRNTRFCGGYAGIGVAVVAFLAVLIPLLSVKSSFKVIDPINNKVQIARAYVTAYLKGDDIDLNELYAYGIDDLTPRKLTFDPITYKDKKLFRVESHSKYNVYLRSWIGTDFDYADETWTSADYETVLSYRDRFGKGFTPDSITNNFYNYVFPSTAEIEGDHTYKNLAKYGFVEEQVSVWRVSGSSLLLFMPSHLNTNIALTKYGGLGEPEYKYSHYFDGVYSSRFYKYGHGYGTVSYVPTYNRGDVGDGISDSIEYYKKCRDIILANKDETDEDAIDYLVYSLDTELQKEGITYLGDSLVLRYFSFMTKEEKAALIKAFETETEYAAYAAETYSEPVDSLVIEGLAEQIQADAEANDEDGNLTTHEIVMTLVDYFKDNFLYTLEPDSDKFFEDKPVLDAFLTDVKEGSSIHFATAAVEVLRKMGIPTRYVEGIIADGFEETSIYTAPYVSEAYDYNAHAWIEVYCDGIGWVTYEVTPTTYLDDIYSPDASTITPDELFVEEEPEDKFADDKNESVEEIIARLGKKEDELVEESDFTWAMKRIVPVLIIVAVLGILFLIGRFIYKKGQRSVADRFRVIDRARSETVYKDNNIDNTAVIKEVNDLILQILEIGGLAPNKGETPMEFGIRLSEEAPELSTVDPQAVFDAMERSEFGHGLSFEDTSLCGEYLSDIITNVYRKLNLPTKIILRYVKRKI